MNRYAPWIWTFAALTLLGCGTGVSLNTPAGFAEIDDDTYAYRATSAEGVVLGVRREPNEPSGNLDFWSSAVRYELERKGYAHVAGEEVRLPSGPIGRHMKYRSTRDGRPFVYQVTVFVVQDTVLIVEAGGDEAHFGKVQQAVDRAVRELDLG